jgi:SagB-type dehydrogenase family enzyme
LVGTGQSLAAGLYHYDPAHHALHVLRLGAAMHVLLEGLWRTPARQPDYAFLLSTAFWKNGFKYQEFSYRLQSLDTGCLLSQVQLVAEHYQLEPTIHLRFLDARMNDFLGLDSDVESVYAIVTVNDSRDQSTLPQAIHETQAPNQRAGLPKMRDQCQALTQWPLVEALHRASQIDTKSEMHAGSLPRLDLPASGNLEIELPAMSYRYERSDASHRRSSEPEHFRAHPLTLKKLALLLQAGAQGYRCDLDGERGAISHTILCCVINHVEGVSPGVYLYQPERHCLRAQRLGNFQPALQETQPGSWLQTANISLCIVPVGTYKDGFDAYGDRWYRMQNMEAGMVTQRIYLACAASALGCRASLTFRDEATDELLALPKDYTSLIQILVSPLDRVIQPQDIGDRRFLW